MSIPEEAGKVASSAIDVLRRDPFYLALLLLTGFFGALTFYAYQLDADRRATTVDILLKKCVPYVTELRPESHPGRDEGQ
jgi:hypothetical protein